MGIKNNKKYAELGFDLWFAIISIAGTAALILWKTWQKINLRINIINFCIFLIATIIFIAGIILNIITVFSNLIHETDFFNKKLETVRLKNLTLNNNNNLRLRAKRVSC